MFYYGTQYFRPPNPFRQFWEDDFKKMKEYGFNVVKLWVMWSIVNHRDGVYDFDDLERLAEIAGKNGLKVIFNTIIENAPYWLIGKYPEAMHTSALGYMIKPQSRGNTPSGGWPGLCLHNEPVREAAACFLREIANKFKDLGNLYAFDIWNETKYEPVGFFPPDIDTGLFCYCQATQQKFIGWLKCKYVTIDEINKAWYRKYSGWDEVYAPTQRGGYPDMLDWLAFRIEDAVQQMQWRYDTIKKEAAGVKLISHFDTLDKIRFLSDVSSFAKIVDEWGVSSFNGIYNRAGDVDEYMLYRLDTTRVDAGGKRFWQSELKGGQNTSGNAHCALKRSPVVKECTMSAWNWSVLMSGAKGLMYWQYRPEQLGPESPGNGLTDLAGRETERLKRAAWFAEFTNRHEFIQYTVPVKGEIGVLKLQEAEKFCYLLDDKTGWYEKAIQGVYRAFSSFNYVVDIIQIDDIKNYDLVYIPFAYMIDKQNINSIKQYIEGGGKVITEACTAHYTDGGYCSFHIPGEMTDIFGAEELAAESLFDIEDKPVIYLENGIKLRTAVYQERLTPLCGKVIGRYEDGDAAIVENAFGYGKVILVGTHPSILFSEEQSGEHREFFKFVLDWAGKENNVSTGDEYVKGRLHSFQNKYYLYVVNLKNEDKEAEFIISSKFGMFSNAVSTVTGISYEIAGNRLKYRLKNCEGDIIQLGQPS